jgi:hypothetical protein
VRLEGEQMVLDREESMHAVAAVHQLLHRKGIFISTERADI